MKKILIGSSIKQSVNILNYFLISLKNLNKTNLIVDYMFIDDNNEDEVKKRLQQFKDEQEKGNEKVIIEETNFSTPYVKTDNTHLWNETLIWHVAENKNKIIQYCIDNEYDYLFLIDSDIVCHKETLLHLIETKKDIISEIFWTKFKKTSPYLPQVWLSDHYTIYKQDRGEPLTNEEIIKRKKEFINTLKKPGIYKVGGLGACTLIHCNVLKAGVNFDEIYNLSFAGEDRHFCIRATSFGYELFVDTIYPAYHIYRDEDLNGVEAFINQSSGIINPEIKERLTSFLTKFYQCDYRIHTLYEGLEYCSERLQYCLLHKQEEQLAYLKKEKIKSEIKITSLKILSEDDTNVSVDASFILYYHDEVKLFSGNFELTKNKTWFINHISFKNEDDKSILGYTLKDIIENKNRIDKSVSNRITLMMLIHNEGNKFLEEILTHATQYVDEVVILDDNSTDNSIEICKRILKNIPHKIIQNKTSQFHNEIILRKQLWNETIKTNPDWILCLDADELFDDKIKQSIKLLIDQPSFDFYSFRLYDMWNKTHYREDKYWQAHKSYKPYLIRYQPNFNYSWQETPQHCGRFPNNLFLLRGCLCKIKLKHFGWSNENLRREKYKRYLSLDPNGTYGNMNQYRSILDPYPNLIPWDE